MKFKAGVLVERNDLVAPFVGAWIEINNSLANLVSRESLRSSERGLKSETVSVGGYTLSRSVRRSVD